MSSLDELQQSAISNIAIGNIAQGTKLLRTCLELTKDQSGSSSLDFAQAEFSLALCLFKAAAGNPSLSDLGEIHDLTKDALAIRTHIKGRVDAFVAVCVDFFGTICEQMHNLTEAERAFNLSLENALTLVGESHVNTANAQLNLARVLLKIQIENEVPDGPEALDQAKKLIENSLATRTAIFGPAAPETVAAIDLLTLICEKRNETTEKTLSNASGDVFAPSQNRMR